MTFYIFKNTHMKYDDPSLNSTNCLQQNQVPVFDGVVTDKNIFNTVSTPFVIKGVSGVPNSNDSNIYGISYNDLTQMTDQSGCYFAKECPSDMNDTNIKFNDPSYNNDNGQIWNLCHTDSLQKIYNKKQERNSQLKNLLLVIFVSSLALLALGVCGTCYEFWLKYGDSVDCLYYKSNCKNAGPRIIKSNGDTTGNEISLIDYIYPNNELSSVVGVDNE